MGCSHSCQMGQDMVSKDGQITVAKLSQKSTISGRTVQSAQNGTPVSLNLRCSDGRSVQIAAQMEWKVSDLCCASQQTLGIHRACQKLLFAGKRMEPKQTLSEIGILDSSTIFVMITPAFPEKLGPFATYPLSFKAHDFQMPPWNDDFQTHGTMWTMEYNALQRNGIKANGIELPLFGQLSPVHPVTLTDEEKTQAHIPIAATDFMWSYPVCGWDELIGEDAAKSLLAVGGYFYFNEKHKLVGTTTLMPMDGDGGLQFSKPKQWNPIWTKALMRQGRFHAITIQPLREVGAKHFCWLRPGEKVLDEKGHPLQEQPEVDHGGFAYLFHDNPLSEQADEVLEDRYFTIVSGDEYVAPELDNSNNESFKAFSLANQLLELEETRAKLASAKTADLGKLQADIDRLELNVAKSAKRGAKPGGGPACEQEVIALRGWGVTSERPGTNVWTAIESMLHVTDTQNLGIGRDVRMASKYERLVPVCIWKVVAPIREYKYMSEKLQVTSHARLLNGASPMPQTKTKLVEASNSLGVDGAVNETFLLHGTKPENVLAILQNGLNERFSGGLFGNGVYAAEDPSKMDQYCTVDNGKSTYRALYESLYYNNGHRHGDVYYCFACRAMLGVPAFTKDGEKNLSTGDSVFQGSGKRELAYIPNSNPPYPYHTLIAEAGSDCRVQRHREFVFFHSERIVPEYLIAYKRQGMEAL